MAHEDYETSVERGQPVELYRFFYGATEYAYTNAEQEISYEGVDYTPLPISRSNISSKARAESQEVTVEVPKTSGVSELFRVGPPTFIVLLTIRQGHIPNPDDPDIYPSGSQFPVVWTGRVLESQRGKNTTTFSCESSEASIKRVGLRRHYQWACPLVLYGSRCRADKEASKIEAVVTGVAGNVVSVSAAFPGAFNARDFVGGLLEWNGANGREYRTIVRTQSGTLVLNSIPTGLADDDDIDVFLGCQRTIEACEDLHDNVVNYGGHKDIPTKNPVGKNNHT